MRVILIVIATFGFYSTAVFGQSASDIGTKYGKPVVVYSVSEHIWMTPAYNARGQVCLMRLYPKRVSPDANYLGDTLPIDEVLKVIDELIPPHTRGARKDFFGTTTTGGGVAWTRFNYDHVAFMFVSSFRLEKIPESEPFDLSDVDERSLAEAAHKEAMRPDNELIRERTASPKVLEIRWANRKCVGP